METLGDAAKRLLTRLEARVAKEAANRNEPARETSSVMRRAAAGAVGMRVGASSLASPFCAGRAACNDNQPGHASTSERLP